MCGRNRENFKLHTGGRILTQPVSLLPEKEKTETYNCFPMSRLCFVTDGRTTKCGWQHAQSLRHINLLLVIHILSISAGILIHFYALFKPQQGRLLHFIKYNITNIL
jgi:hypothetical protein